MSADTPYFNPADFQSAQISVKVRNGTSKTSLSDQDSIAVLELMEKGLRLELPPRSCAQGHQLELELTVVPPQQNPQSMQATGKVVSAEITEGGAIEAEVEFIQFVTEEWKQFQSVFSARQKDIEAFLNGARGSE